MITAKLQNHRQSPRKVRLVADLVRGKKVNSALSTLDFLTKKAADPVRSVIEMAVSNAKHSFKLDKEKLYIQEIKVDEGTTLMRRMPRAHGSAAPIRKRSSHITVVLGEQARPNQLLAVNAQKDIDDEEEVNDDESEK